MHKGNSKMQLYLARPLGMGPVRAEALRPVQALKECLTTAPGLHTFDSRRRSILTTDAREQAISTVLTQPDDNGIHHPVAFESRKLTTAEQAYPAHPDPPASCQTSPCARTTKQSRGFVRSGRSTGFWCWLDEIEELCFEVEHVPGKPNPADPLSRGESRRGLPASARPSRPTAFADARAPAKASDVVGLETAPSAVREGGR